MDAQTIYDIWLSVENDIQKKKVDETAANFLMTLEELELIDEGNTLAELAELNPHLSVAVEEVEEFRAEMLDYDNFDGDFEEEY